MTDEQPRQSWMPQLEFDTDEVEFTRGVELGIVWIVLKGYVHAPMQVAPPTFQVHASNSEMMLRVAESYDLEFSAEIIDDDWTSITFKKKAKWKL